MATIMSISIILGTRPEIIKMSPVIRECEERGLDYFVIHTGQHYSYEMDEIFFGQLDLSRPKYKLEGRSLSHATQIGRIMVGVEEVLEKDRPEVVLVQGDTNTVLAGALAAAKLHIKVGHVEAGLRSFDKSMPEEINRIVADHISDYLFAPTDAARRNLVNEGLPSEKIFTHGNTIVDSIRQNLEISRRKVTVLEDLGLKTRSYFLATAHREENVDNRKRLEGIARGIRAVCEEFSLPVVFPMHPRTKKRLEEFDIDLDCAFVTDPVGFLEFLQLEANAKLVLSDSGGVQEETCIIGTPCVTLRENTERPETLDVGSNLLVGTAPEDILLGVKRMLDLPAAWKNPFGDGAASKRIVNAVRRGS
jgi:UDP-N-acetylglucosamine 2-epimerase (non-hydrolysing)